MNPIELDCVVLTEPTLVGAKYWHGDRVYRDDMSVKDNRRSNGRIEGLTLVATEIGILATEDSGQSLIPWAVVKSIQPRYPTEAEDWCRPKLPKPQLGRPKGSKNKPKPQESLPGDD